MDSYEVIIIGLGPAGCTAGIYATRFGLKTLVIGKEPGGQANEAHKIDNYPGMLGVKGADIMSKFREHAKALGVEIIYTEVVDIKKKSDGFIVKTESGEYEAKSVIIATGKKRRQDIPGENELRGRGVSNCATCDAPFFKNKVVCVIGGSNSAVMSALMLAEHAKKTYLTYRKGKDDMRAMPTWVTSAETNPKIEMIFNAIPKRIEGKEFVQAILFDKEGKEFSLKVDGVFVENGAIPQTELALKLGVAVEEKSGKIKVGPDMVTNVKGVFAAGDVTNGSADFEQIIIAAAEGANAARSAYKYVRKRD
ncbi:MAG: FAD-dependent oxidoreductase [Candidatus Aenigmarchaeota archaeon]|nr:FAD-dependent oxidoreductase [Candidatus Aenigmarchaeota archaeon]